MVLTIFPVPKYKTGLISVQAVMATRCMCSSPQYLLSSVSEVQLKSSHSHHSCKPLAQIFDWHKSEKLHWVGWSCANLWKLRFRAHVLIFVYSLPPKCVKKIWEYRRNCKCGSIHSWFGPFHKCKYTRMFFLFPWILFSFIYGLLNKTGDLLMKWCN